MAHHHVWDKIERRGGGGRSRLVADGRSRRTRKLALLFTQQPVDAEVSSMKTGDSSLRHYLIQNLKPMTEADPTLLADYVVALLKNNRPKKELQKLCIDQLYDFLGEGTKLFVFNLFRALEDGTIPSISDNLEGSEQLESTDAPGGGVEMRTSPSHLERLPSSGLHVWNEEGEEEESSDDDRNHKHRRRVSRSRSLDPGEEPDSSRFNGRPPNDMTHQARGHDRGLAHFDREHSTKYDRRSGREHASRHFSNGDEGQRNMIRGGPRTRGEVAGLHYDGMRMFQGRGGAGPWGVPLRPPSFPEGPSPLLPPSSGFYPGARTMAGRGAEWSTGFGPMHGMGSGPMEHAHHGQGSGAVGMGMGIRAGRPRCPDFEERGFCLRGDLCPLEHGANRIVVEDVQDKDAACYYVLFLPILQEPPVMAFDVSVCHSLSKFNLPVTLPNGRGMGMGSGPMTISSGPMLPSNPAIGSRGARVSQEPSVLPIGEVSVPANEPDLYDPDQPLWNKDRIGPSGRITKLPSFHKGPREQVWEGDAGNNHKTDRSSEVLMGGGASDGGIHGADVGSTVWDRIGPVDRSAEGRPSVKDRIEDQQVQSRGRGLWPGKWERQLETPHVHAVTGRGRGVTARGEVGLPGQRAKEGSSFGSRSTIAHGVVSERAHQTLYVSCIPPTSNRTEVLLSHFEKFGQVVDVRIPPHSDRAFVQFASREAAESALASPDAVLGNRFIRLSWANRDSILSNNVGSSPATGHLLSTGSEPAAVHSIHNSKGMDKLGLAQLNGMGSGYVPETPAKESIGQVATSNGSQSSVAASGGIVQKKQEELELMREKIRQKQEALAKKRDEFRRKLERLSNQGAGEQGDNSEDQQASKRQKLDDNGDSNIGKEGVVAGGALTTAVLRKSISGEIPHASPKLGKSPHPNMNTPGAIAAHTSSAAWGPARFKLDNRPSVLRVLAPLPPTLTDVAVAREHFAMFGEVASLEVEDAEGHKVDITQPLTINSNLRVSFTNRRSAERALGQGKWLQGQTLHLAWAPVSSSRVTDGNGAANNSLLRGDPEALNGREGSGHDENAGIGEYTSEEDKATAKDARRQVILRVAQQESSGQCTDTAGMSSSSAAVQPLLWSGASPLA